MKSNISLFAMLLTLAGCGGGRGYQDNPPETVGAPDSGSAASQTWNPRASEPRQSAPAQSWDAPSAPAGETWRAADGSVRSRRPAPVRQETPEPSYPRSGTSYAAPGELLAPEPQTVPQPQQDGYADPAAGANGPSGSSRPGPGEARYDEIGYAGVRGVSGGGAMDSAIVAVSRTLPVDSYAEVTSLDTGRTILVLITGAMEPGANHPIDLSAGAARQLGITSDGASPVRIRRVNPSGPDQSALRSGRAATDRPDAPPVLLNAMRKRLPGVRTAAPTPGYSRPAAPATRPAVVKRAPTGRGFYVQVAALSNAANAQSLAQRLSGFVKPGGGLYRVQLGPFATQAQAQAARGRAAGAGYKDARVFAN